ncbi:MAG: hypothetical protein ACREUW_00735 [Burkholderiales bacterium]
MNNTTAIIIAGRFDAQKSADEAIHQLLHVGFPADRFTSFFVNPPGHHDRFPIGGDRDESPGAKGADGGAAKGAAIGGAIGLGVGLAATPLAGPAAAVGGAGVGAYVGSLVGALNQLGGEEGERVRVRESGVLVAVQTRSADDERLVIDLLQRAGAHEIERAQGRWEAGKWADFDALRPPILVKSVDVRSAA